MATKGDVDLVIRARNEAGKALEAVTKALNELADQQADISASSEKAGSALANFAKVAATVGNAYNKIATDADKAAQSVARQEKNLAETQAAYQALVAQLEAATRVQARLRRESEQEGADKQKLSAQLKLVGKAYADLEAQVQRTARRVAQQEAAYRQSFYALQQITGSADQAKAALDRVREAQDRAAKSAADSAAKEAQLAAQQERLAQVAARRSALELRRSMMEAAASSQTAWRDAQEGIRRLAHEIGKAGAQTSEQVAKMTALANTARANKQAYSEIRVAIEQYTRVLRDQSATQQQVAAAQDQAKAALDRVREAQDRAAKSAADAAAKEAQLGAQQERLAQVAARRSALELRRSMLEAASASQGAWRDAQEGIRRLSQEMSQAGSQTSEQVAQMAALANAARANKQAYNEIRVAIEQYTRVLRDQSATQQQVAAAQERARAALAGVRNAMTGIASSARSTANEQNNLANSSRKAADATTQLDRSLRSLFANSRRSLSLYQRLRGQVLSLTSSYIGLYGAINGVNRAIQASMTMQAVESRLNVVTGGNVAETAAEMEWVKAEAYRLGFSIETLAGEWSKFAVSAQASNFTMAETRKIFTSVAEAGRVLKLNSQQVERAFVAITQMMSKGTIQMEELRQQLGEHIPGAFALMVEAMDVSGAELSRMMEQGQLTSDALLKFADVLDKRFGSQLEKSLQMTQAEMGRFQTAVMLALNDIANSGVIDEFTNALRRLTEMLRSAEAQVWFDRIGAAIGGVIRALMSLLENLDLILAALTALGVARGVGYVLDLKKAFSNAILEIRTARTAAVGLRTVLAGIGGPIGLGISLLAGAFAFLATRVNEAEKSMHSAADAVGRITNAYRKGAKSAEEWTKALQGMSELELERDLRNLRRKLERELRDIYQPFSRRFMARVRASDSPLKDVYEELVQIAEKASIGRMSVADFKKRLDEIAKTHPRFRDIALRMQESANEAQKTEEALRKLEASIRLMRGEASEADRDLLGLPKALDDTTKSAERGASVLEKYTEAMDELRKMVPRLRRELELEANLAKVTSNLQKALDEVGQREARGELTPAQAAQLRQEAMDIASQATRELKRGFDEAIIREFSQTRGDALLKSVNLLKQFEGFRPTAYWDVNAYRVGYGSDTVTLDDGSIRKVTQGMKVSQEDALRDLVRRVGEFQNIVKGQIGSDRWSLFTPEQQAALTSIAYNYGSLPKRIVEAVKYGTSEEIAAAVRSLRGDNGGINAKLREMEAQILAEPNPRLEQDRLAAVEKVTSELQKQLDLVGKTELQKRIIEALDKAGVKLESEKGREIAQQVTKLYEAEQAAKAHETAEKRVNDLLALRKEIQEQIEFQRSRGNTEAILQLEQQLASVDERLQEAIDSAIKFWQAMGGPEAELALARLDNLRNTISDVTTRTIEAQDVANAFTNAAVQGFDRAAQAIAGWIDGTLSGKEALKQLRNVFLQFAADFLRQLSHMIMQAIIFNMVSGFLGGAGAPMMRGLRALVAHTGGIVQEGRTSRLVSPAWFTNAVRYHSGGIAGLAPDEVPAILRRGEEVLTKDDPRHRANGGGQGVGVRIINVIDPEMAADYLNSAAGEKTILNVLSRNSSAVRELLR
ncbi:MAG: tape measure protein [Sphaerochaetaceae bacterium]